MHPLNAFFDKIFIISIRRNRSRLESFLAKNCHLEVEVFNGVDGKELFPKLPYVGQFPITFFHENQLSYQRCSCLNKGQLGCAISNLLVQKTIVEKQIKKALILEDDAYLLSHRLKIFDLALHELPPDWELFYLGYTSISKWSEQPLLRFILRMKHFLKPSFVEDLSTGSLNKRVFSSNYSKTLRIPGIYTGTHAYALSLEGARKIVMLDTPLQYGFDTTLFRANYHKLINAFAMKKPLFIPDANFETSLIN